MSELCADLHPSADAREEAADLSELSQRNTQGVAAGAGQPKDRRVTLREGIRPGSSESTIQRGHRETADQHREGE
jgi:hypothetical protein